MDLFAQWNAYKLAEKDANEKRLAVEALILKKYKKKISAEGTTHLDGVSIVTGYDRKWDQKKLEAIKKKLGNKSFPFKTEYKEVRAESKVLEEAEDKGEWEVFADALTIKPKKPSFKSNGE